MRKIAIGFVIYNPTPNLILRMELALALDFILYVFDNSPQNGIVRNFCKNLKACRYLTCGKNVGLGFGISSVCAQAYYDSYQALLFFDQDTVFDSSTLRFIEGFYINNVNISYTYSAMMFNSKKYTNVATGKEFAYRDVLMSINSGSLYFLDNMNKLNWFNETYFVDCVDYEFCLNSNNNNFKIGECSNAPGFDHESEQGDVKYVIFGKERKLRRYSAKRIFNTTAGSTRLFFSSIIKRNMKFFVAITRSFSGYLFWQFMVRLMIIFKVKNG